MESWFPSLGDSAYTSEPLIVAFHGAGSTESAFSSAGAGRRRVDTLLNGAQERGITIASVQLPGRGKRSYEPALQSAPGIAQKLVNEALEPLIVQNHHSLNQFRKYIIVAHSMGSLIAVEAMKHLRKRWKDERVLPRILIVSCFPAPNTPHNDLPWNPSGSKLSNNEFQHELKLWDVNEAVWKSERVWSMYNEMLRNDFKVFENYFGYGHEAKEVIGGERFNMPIIGTMAKNDRVKDEHMHGWSTFTSSSFELHELDGSHNFIQGESGSGLQTKAKRQLHQIILQAADEHLAC